MSISLLDAARQALFGVATATADTAGQGDAASTAAAGAGVAGDAGQTGAAEPLATIQGLRVSYRQSATAAVDGVDLALHAGKITALVGESGSGKSTLGQALLGLLPDGARTEGSIVLPEGAHGLGLIPQDPARSLNPVRTIGYQLVEALRLAEQQASHGGTAPPKQPSSRQPRKNRSALRAEAVKLLAEVGLADAADRLDVYPHELSGGQKQRVLIAIACAQKPRLLIADEPTSALDATTQQRILKVLDEVRQRQGCGILFITHNLGLADQWADEIAVMRHGKVVDRFPARAGALSADADDYTRRLWAAAQPKPRKKLQPLHPSGHSASTASGDGGHSPAALEVRGLVKQFPQAAAPAVAEVGFTLEAGRTLALVGESGSGKSTTAALVMGLLAEDAGEIRFHGEALPAASSKHARRRWDAATLWRQLQLVYQNPDSALNPRWSVHRLIAEPLRHSLRLPRAERARRVAELAELVQLPAQLLPRRPAELSGGQRQRVAIARALASGANTLVLDEALSALDAATGEQILQLLTRLQQEQGLSYLFISHDLNVVEHFADAVAVMQHGRIVEYGPTATIFDHPEHPYTQELLAARTPVLAAATPGKDA